MITETNVHVAGLPEAIRTRVLKAVFGGLHGVPVTAVRGADRARGIVYSMRGETQVVRPYRIPRDPKSPAQLALRERWRVAKRSWSEIAIQDRAGWKRYGTRWSLAPNSARNAGYNSFVRVQTYRQAVAPQLAGAVPTQEPPGPVEVIRQVPAPTDALGFRIEHHIAQPEGMWLLVEMTPATPTLRRKPREGDLRWARGTGEASFVPLAPSGSGYVIDGVRYALHAGERYGMRLRVISAEGVPGPTLCADFLKEEGPVGASIIPGTESTAKRWPGKHLPTQALAWTPLHEPVTPSAEQDVCRRTTARVQMALPTPAMQAMVAETRSQTEGYGFKVDLSFESWVLRSLPGSKSPIKPGIIVSVCPSGRTQ